MIELTDFQKKLARVLLDSVYRRESVLTYTELVERTGEKFDLRGIGRQLGQVSVVCYELGLPFITAMVVKKDTGHVGPGYIELYKLTGKPTNGKSNEVLWAEDIQAVRECKDWHKLEAYLEGRIVEEYKYIDDFDYSRLGRYDSWNVINPETIAKGCDKSFFDYNGSGVPKGIRWFFQAETLTNGEKIAIKLIYHNRDNSIIEPFNAYVAMEKNKLSRTRIFWENRLGEELRKYRGCERILFVKNHDEKYDCPVYDFYFPNECFNRIAPEQVIIVEDENALSKEELIEIAQTSGSEHPERRETVTQTYERSHEVVVGTRARANGKCELCRRPAPFVGNDGTPYLEVHHIVWLSQGGSDTLDNTVALCPNCHRKMHNLALEEDIAVLKEVAASRT